MPKSEWLGKVVWTMPENIRHYADIKDALKSGRYVEAPSNLDIDASLAGDLVVLKNKIPIYGQSEIPWFKSVWMWSLVMGIILMGLIVSLW